MIKVSVFGMFKLNARLGNKSFSPCFLFLCLTHLFAHSVIEQLIGIHPNGEKIFVQSVSMLTSTSSHTLVPTVWIILLSLSIVQFFVSKLQSVRRRMKEKRRGVTGLIGAFRYSAFRSISRMWQMWIGQMMAPCCYREGLTTVLRSGTWLQAK